MTGDAPALATAQQVAVGWLRRAIASGSLRPGDRIGQDAVAGQIGVSLIPVREALRILESEGLVRYAPRRGYSVTRLDLADLEEIYHLRRLLEDDAVLRGLPRATADDLAALEEAASSCRAAARDHDISGGLAANRRFHFLLFALAGDGQQQRLIRMLWDATEAYRALYYDLPGGEEEAEAAHSAVVSAAREGDVDTCIAVLDGHREAALAALRATLGSLATNP